MGSNSSRLHRVDVVENPGIDVKQGEVVEALLGHASENDAQDVAVLDVPQAVLEDAGAEYLETPDEHGRKMASTLVAGPIAHEDEDVLSLDSPSRVGGREDFSTEVRRRLRADGVYGFRDGNLEGYMFPKDEVEIYRP